MKHLLTVAFTLIISVCLGQATVSQTIDFPEIESVEVGEVSMIPLFPKASSGLPVTLTYTAVQGSIQIAGNVLVITDAFAGNIIATQAGNDVYLPVQVMKTFVVSRGSLPITMAPIPEKTTADVPFTPLVNPPGTITFTSSDPAVATIVGGQVKIIGKGTTIITAKRLANAAYGEATTTRDLVVKDPHSIAFNSIAEKKIGDLPFDVTATASSALPVTFMSSDPSVATVAGNTITIHGVGSTQITASAGNATFAVATSTQVLQVKNVSQTQGQQGQIFGIQTVGGAGQIGAIYRMNSDGSGFRITKSFRGGDEDGSIPTGSLVMASNGKFYGTTRAGGAFNGGTMFSFDPGTKEITKLYDFLFDDYPLPKMVAGPGGKLYGAKYNSFTGTRGQILFEYDVATNTFTKSKLVDNVVLVAVDMYMTSTGRIYCSGLSLDYTSRVFFEYEPATNTTVSKGSIANSDSGTSSGMTEGSNGKIYGTFRSGGTNSQGFVFEFDPSINSVVAKASFENSGIGYTDASGLTKASNGKLYGTTTYGGPGMYGYLYEFDPVANKINKLAYFSPSLGFPIGQLKEGSNGRLYGSGSSGGRQSFILEFNPVTNELIFLSVLDAAAGTDIKGNIEISGNKIYAAASVGGANNTGTIIELDYTTHVVKKLTDFGGDADGYLPKYGLTPASNGKLYGVTQSGGASNLGTLYEYDPMTDVVTTKVNFHNATLGSFPQTGLTSGVNGKLYGTTNSGGLNNVGTLYEFDPQTGNATVVIQLQRSGIAGSYWNGEVVQSASGKIYGVSSLDGTDDVGTLVEVDPTTKAVKRLMSFAGPDGRNPNTGLMIASNGKIYGTSSSGGSSGNGVLFEYDINASAYNVKYHFAGGSPGAQPSGGLIELNGKLYGLTQNGGGVNYGVLYEYNLSTGAYLKKYDFGVGQMAVGKLLYAANGKMYGQTMLGGDGNSTGVIFEYDPVTNAVVKRQDLPHSWIAMSNTALTQTVTTMKRDQIITITPIEPKSAGQSPFTPTAVTTSGLPAVFSAGSSNISLVGNSISFNTGGKGIVKANQAGNSSFNPAPEVQAEFCVNPAKPTITFNGANTTAMTLTSSNATGNQWFNDEIVISGATGAALQVIQPGIYSVQTTVDGCVGEMSLPFAVIVTGDQSKEESLQVYPNPVSDRLYIALPGGNMKRVMLLHTDGRIAEEHNTSARLLEVDVRSYAAGLYIVRIADENGESSPMKFIKK